MFLQCAKALIRSRLWQASNQVSYFHLPSAAEMLCDHVQSPDFDIDKMQSLLDQAYREKLY